MAITFKFSKDLLKDLGLHRSMLANGLSTLLSGFSGSIPNTTYGENIAVLAITRVYSWRVLAGAAIMAIILSFCAKLAAIIVALPVAVMVGISLLLYGVIAASDIRVLIESRVDYSQPKNLILTALVLITSLCSASVQLAAVQLKGMALATVLGIVLSLLFSLFEKIQSSSQ